MPGVLNLGFLTINTAIALLCFILCIVVDPGRCANVTSVTVAFACCSKCLSQSARAKNGSCATRMSPSFIHASRSPSPQLDLLAFCRVPAEYAPDPEANTVLQVKRKVSNLHHLGDRKISMIRTSREAHQGRTYAAIM